MQNPGGRSPILIIGDHAGCEIPARLADLGLPREEIERHIGWDIGVAELGRALSAALDASFIAQRFSRLVIDCNRDPARPDAMCEVSDGASVPGNLRIPPAQRAARIAEIFQPYHDKIAAELDERIGAARATVLLALHSFTPRLGGQSRPWRVGVLHMGESDYAYAVLAGLREALPAEQVGDNQPYAMDGTDYSVPRHAIARRLAYVELEVRQDLLGDEQAIATVSKLLADILVGAFA